MIHYIKIMGRLLDSIGNTTNGLSILLAFACPAFLREPVFKSESRIALIQFSIRGKQLRLYHVARLAQQNRSS